MSFINRDYDKPLKACGKKVVIRKLERNHDCVLKGIFIPTQSSDFFKLVKGTVESVGSETSESGVKVGDVVLYDSHSVFYDHHPVVVTNFENVVVILERKTNV